MRFRPPRRGRTSRYELGMGVGLGSYGATQSFTPLSLAPSLWLDASVASSLFQNSNGTTAATADGDPVGYWGDLSGNGRHRIQGTAGARPLLKTALANGRNVIQFDGTNDFLSGAFGATLSQPFTLFLACKGQSSANKVFFDSSGVHGTRMKVGGTATQIEITTANNTAFATYNSQTPGNAHVYTLILNGAAGSSFRVDGTTQTLGSGSWGASGDMPDLFLAEDAGGAAWMTGDFYELILVNSVASTAAVEAYLKNKWGTP